MAYIVIEELYEYKIKASRQKNTTSTLSDPTPTSKDRTFSRSTNLGFRCVHLYEKILSHIPVPYKTNIRTSIEK